MIILFAVHTHFILDAHFWHLPTEDHVVAKDQTPLQTFADFSPQVRNVGASAEDKEAAD